MKILIAEDDAVSQRLLQVHLERMGHEVAVARDGAEAWHMFEREPTRIIVSDWMMPEMDGLALCHQVRARPSREYTYFVLLTAKQGKESYRQAMEIGVDDFLTKPLDRDELAIRLRVAERIVGFTTQIRQLRALLPICMYCKKIRDDQNYWQQIESYLHAHTGSDFSHSVCPSCYQEHLKPKLDEMRSSARISQ